MVTYLRKGGGGVEDWQLASGEGENVPSVSLRLHVAKGLPEERQESKSALCTGGGGGRGLFQF